VPLLLSVLLDDNQQAEGNILIEDETGLPGGEEYYYLKMQGNLLSIKQQNNGSIPYQNNKNISYIVISGGSVPWYSACAILNDLKTVQPLVIYTSELTGD
jgi:hypothetical protein